jgi:hypothetical protein
MSARHDSNDDRWSGLSRQELILFGRTSVIERLEGIGCRIEDPPATGPLPVTTPTGREVEVFVSTQRLGGYAFWTKRRLQPASDRFAAIVLLSDPDEPEVFVLPTTEWRNATPPFRDRDNIGKRSEPEYGVSLARSWLPALQRFGWDPAAVAERLDEDDGNR